MKTYNCFGYHHPNHTANLEISIPNGNYDYELCNVSTNGWNGLVVNLMLRNNDPGHGLQNPNMDFETVQIDLSKVDKIGAENVNDFDYTKPIIVFTHHTKDTNAYASHNEYCYTELKNRNVLDASILEGICNSVAGPAKSGYGTLKKI
ncbi:hypothetical protein [Flavobacterium litorale]|uniref:Uncharacterized protein n=1 Tax=Flavobacterium litorale TaxID=2856519 RepID=A0ABX8V5M1_9FLAO|nr:hypothetical protein [Flavobacterium litorale]QYJ68131.1 hypothetical protein K1I41_11465 [Flavobacterium litorale]